MQDNEIRSVFSRVFKNKANFMTPYTLKLGKRGKMIWEISTGEGFRGARLYGVTVIELPSEKRHDLSKCFSTLEEAEAYIKGDFTHA
jgi:hypothetical protein